MVKTLKPTKTKIIKAKAESIKDAKVPVVEFAVAAKPLVKRSWWQAVAWGRISIALLVLIILVGGSIWFFSGRSLVIDNISSGQLSEKQESMILAKISKHISLPAAAYQIGVATDPDKLKALSPFYDRVKVNDVVVVSDNFALIYDERSDVLINATMLSQPQSGQ